MGTQKVKSIENAIKQICRWVKVEAVGELWTKEEGGALLEGADWVIGLFPPLLIHEVTYYRHRRY